MAIFSEPLHHAYLIIGKRAESREKLLEALKEELGLEAQGNPDFSEQFFETFNIDEARNLSLSQINRGVGNSRRIYIISFYFATIEAQNALLKTLEEPTPNTSFFIITSQASVLLPTVRSRLSRLSLGIEEFVTKEAKNFLSSTISERLKIIEKISKSDNENKKSDLLSLLIGIEEACADNFKGEIPVNWAEPLRELLELKRFAFDRAPSVKMLGEYLALRLPLLEVE